MRTLILAVGLLISINSVQAQYETLVETKLQHLNTLAQSVQTDADLSALDKAWALKHIESSQERLKATDQSNIEALQTAEAQINQTSKKIAGRILMTKKVKLMNRITTLTAIIEQYQAEGLDTERLEALKEAMQMHLNKY